MVSSDANTNNDNSSGLPLTPPRNSTGHEPNTNTPSNTNANANTNTNSANSPNPNYMSEPSLSEDNNSNCNSNPYAQLSAPTSPSPLNRSISLPLPLNMHMHMTLTNSPSNSCTSLSSLGSPGVSRTTAIARKRMHHFADINCNSNANANANVNIVANNMGMRLTHMGMGSLLSPIQAGSDQEQEPKFFPDLNSDSKRHCSDVDADADVNVDANIDSDAHIDINADTNTDADADTKRKGSPQTQNCQSSIPTLTPNTNMNTNTNDNNMKPRSLAQQENEFDLESAAYIKILEPPPSPFLQELQEGSPTPTMDSLRYLTAQESSDDDGDEDDNDDDDDGKEGGSSGLSYDSSSQEEEHNEDVEDENNKNNSEDIDITSREDENNYFNEKITSGGQEKDAVANYNKRQTLSTAIFSANANANDSSGEWIERDAELLLSNSNSNDERGESDTELLLSNSNDEKGESDTERLLSNTDSATMDLLPLNHIIFASPSNNDVRTYGTGAGVGTCVYAMSMHMLTSTSPPKIIPPNAPNRTLQEEEENTITPKRKTSRPSTPSDPEGSGGERRASLMKSMSLPLALGCDDEMGAGGGAGTSSIKPRRKRINSADSKRHRRTRSGDDAAATLLTGSAEWAGMELHNLPLPKDRQADDDDQDEQDLPPEYKKEKSSSREQGHGHGHVSLASRKLQRTRNLRRNFNAYPGESLVFQSISADDVDLMMNMARSPNALEEGISTRFSPRFAGAVKPDPENAMNDGGFSPRFGPVPGSVMERSMSFGDASASTVESNFSWISRGTATIAKEAELNSAKSSASPPLNGTHASNILTPPMANKPRSSSSLLDPIVIARAVPGMEKDIEMQVEQRKKEDFYDEHMRELRNAPSSPTKAPRFEASGKPGGYPTFTCPRCNTVQREFFTVASAVKRFESPAQYIALYFFVYMIMSLFIFGMEEGWPPLDCVYFSVTTLTTTGLGDYVPTTDSAKIICSIFIYFGVSCIGLLLGSMHVSALDDAAKKQAKENMISNCPNCARLYSNSMHSLQSEVGDGEWSSPPKNGLRKMKSAAGYQDQTGVNEMTSLLQLERTTKPVYMRSSQALKTIDEAHNHHGENWDGLSSPVAQLSMASSPGAVAPVETMGKQSHIRHFSLDSPRMKNIFDPNYTASSRKRMDTDVTSHVSNAGVGNGTGRPIDDNISDIDNDHDHDSNSSRWSATSNPADGNEFFTPVSRIKAAKYVFLTLKQAFTNSLFVVLIGSAGFYYIESMTVVDAFYFTTVLLTTVGYGDIVPVTPAGKLFCTIYGLIAGGVLLHQMSMISMIPLELRKRRIERSVLMQFGDELDDAALEELATGPLVQRLQISENSPGGLGQCTREMFALAMLVRLGRITEQDVRSTFAAFKKLDRDNDGLLTSREIIMSAVERKKKEQTDAIPRDAGSLLPKPRNIGAVMTSPVNMSSRSHQNYTQGPESRFGRQSSTSLESDYSAITYEEGDGDYQPPPRKSDHFF